MTAPKSRSDNSIHLTDFNISMDEKIKSEAVVALAKAAEANALAIGRIADSMKGSAPTYGVYVGPSKD